MSNLFDLITLQSALVFTAEEWRKDLKHNPTLNGNSRIQLKKKIEVLERQSEKMDKLILEEIANG